MIHIIKILEYNKKCRLSIEKMMKHNVIFFCFCQNYDKLIIKNDLQCLLNYFIDKNIIMNHQEIETLENIQLEISHKICKYNDNKLNDLWYEYMLSSDKYIRYVIKWHSIEYEK